MKTKLKEFFEDVQGVVVGLWLGSILIMGLVFMLVAIVIRSIWSYIVKDNSEGKDDEG
jgi:hypothetical protein